MASIFLEPTCQLFTYNPSYPLQISPQFHLNHLSLEPAEPPYCPPEEECTAEMRNQDCTCDCNEEPPPKCDLDVVVMIDVCSCSPEVWHGIKSYVDALVTKYDQEIGVRTVIKVFTKVTSQTSRQNNLGFGRKFCHTGISPNILK